MFVMYPSRHGAPIGSRITWSNRKKYVAKSLQSNNLTQSISCNGVERSHRSLRSFPPNSGSPAHLLLVRWGGKKAAPNYCWKVHSIAGNALIQLCSWRYPHSDGHVRHLDSSQQDYISFCTIVFLPASVCAA
jgi:hypothetical protein